VSNICIIPARGGSKRIPRKNIKNFLGKPIISYSIEIALKSKLFDEVIVSTDSEEIAEVARKYGAKVPFIRSEKSSDDYATLSDVVEEVKLNYKKEKKKIDKICLLLSTAPLVNVDILQEAFHLMNNNKFDSVRPVVKFSYPPQRGLRINNGKVSFIFNEYAKTRSQDLEPIFHDAGMFYWMNFEKGLKSENKGAIIVSEKITQDIDTLEDWEIAESKYKIMYDK
jgi:pseudaminic acid cytidylyltransferase